MQCSAAFRYWQVQDRLSAPYKLSVEKVCDTSVGTYSSTRHGCQLSSYIAASAALQSAASLVFLKRHMQLLLLPPLLPLIAQ